MDLYGLIGYPLTHSFSKRYFTEKFSNEGIKASYELFDLPAIEDLPALLKHYPDLKGLNVTIPHKQAVIPYLTCLAPTAQEVGAVNVIKITPNGELIGHNTDYEGFLHTLGQARQAKQAMILGNGGAAKAVEAVLKHLHIPYTIVARTAEIKFEDVTPDMLIAHQLIINTTPLGMLPHVDTLPAIPYYALLPTHWVYDLVYNPLETLFLQKAKAQGANVQNGLPMLYAQAEAGWRIFGLEN